MANQTTAMGTLLLLGVVFLSLNALAVSARPGDGTIAEKTTAIAVATMPKATASGPVAATGGAVAVPAPSPTLNPTLIGSGGEVAMRPAMNPIEGLSFPTGPGIAPPSANVGGTEGIAPAPGVYPPFSGSTAPLLPGNGMIEPGATPIPLPPVTPNSGTLNPVPVPPYAVDPVRNGL